MKRLSRMAGVTLLEIMLVLAIAAMVIVMSIRYYQSASMSQKVNTAMEDITGIVSAGENFLNAQGSYSGVHSISALGPYGLPQGASATSSPWGGKITVSGSTSTMTITIPNIPADACTQFDSFDAEQCENFYPCRLWGHNSQCLLKNNRVIQVLASDPNSSP